MYSSMSKPFMELGDNLQLENFLSVDLKSDEDSIAENLNFLDPTNFGQATYMQSKFVLYLNKKSESIF